MSEVITLDSCYGSHRVVFDKTRKPYEGVRCRSLPVTHSYKEFKGGKLDFIIFCFHDEPPLPGVEEEVSRNVSYAYNADGTGKWSRGLTRAKKDGGWSSGSDPRCISAEQISALNFIIRFLEG